MYFDEIKEKAAALKRKKSVKILAIETSCDETSAAIVENGRIIMSNVIASQIEIHRRFGGVVPEVASRNHILAINNCIDEALQKAKISLKDVDAVAVTYGAGLVGALLVGVSAAKALAYSLRVPLIAVNHIKAHIAAVFIEHKDIKPPFICLVVSGGHTAIVRVDTYTEFTLLGQTQDDAIGEAFDKVARVLGLGYPGGPEIQKAAQGIEGNIEFIKNDYKGAGFDSSFSGLKTAVVNYVNSQRQILQNNPAYVSNGPVHDCVSPFSAQTTSQETACTNSKNKTRIINNADLDIPNIAASFQTQACDGLIEKTILAAQKENLKTITIAGGVAANKYLRENLTKRAEEAGIKVFTPAFEFCTDNAAMIGALAYFNLLEGKGISPLTLKAEPSIELG